MLVNIFKQEFVHDVQWTLFMNIVHDVGRFIRFIEKSYRDFL